MSLSLIRGCQPPARLPSPTVREEALTLNFEPQGVMYPQPAVFEEFHCPFGRLIAKKRTVKRPSGPNTSATPLLKPSAGEASVSSS